MRIKQERVQHPNELDSTNWRFIRDIVRSDGEIQLYLVTHPLTWWVVRDVNVTDFMECYEKNGTLMVKEINRIKETIPCSECLGMGYMDWIDVARGGHPKRFVQVIDCMNFKVDKVVYHWQLENTCFKGSTGIPTTPAYLTTTPKVAASDRLCETCFGSGMELAVKNGNAIYMNSLGRWYTKTKNEDDDEY